MNYLIYIEHAAENLQFFLWYRDYIKRFSNLPANERTLAPEWTVEQAEAEANANQTSAQATKMVSPETAAVFKGTDFAHPKANIVEAKGNPFNTPPMTPNTERESMAQSDVWSEVGSTFVGSGKTSYNKKAGEAYQGADLKWQPCKRRPNVDLVAILIVVQSPFSRSERKFHELSRFISPTVLHVN